MFLKKVPVRVWYFCLTIIVGLSLAFYFILGRGTNKSITNQQLRKNQTIARAEASNIESFLRVFGDSVAIFAKLNSVDDRNEETRMDMDAFVEQWRDTGLVGGIVLADRNGKVIFNSNIEGTHDIGGSIADRDYFIWAKNKGKEGEYVVGETVVSRLGATKGEVIVPLASPIYDNGVFSGVITSPVILQNLAERYLELMKVSDKTHVFLVGYKGNLIYGGLPETRVGEDIFDEKSAFLGSETLSKALKDALDGGREGSLKISFIDPVSGDMEAHLVSWAPVNLDDRNWLVVTASPITDVRELAAPIYVRQTGVLLLVSLSLLTFAIFTTKENLRDQNRL